MDNGTATRSHVQDGARMGTWSPSGTGSSSRYLTRKTSGSLGALFPYFQYKPGCVCTSKLPVTSGMASAKSCSAPFQPFPKGCTPKEDIPNFHNLLHHQICRENGMTAAKAPNPQVKPGLAQDALQEHSGIFPKSNHATWSSDKNLGNTWKNAFFRNSTGRDVPTPCHTRGGLRNGAGLGGPTLTTESLNMRKCPGRHQLLPWGTLSLFLGHGNGGC